MAKLCIADCETTTRNAQTGAIHDFGFILELDGKEVARESIKMRPTIGRHDIDNESLRVSGVTADDICQYELSQGDGAFRFAQIMFRAGFNEGVHLVGWNVGFDESFIREWLGPAYYGLFHSNHIDVMSLASWDLQNVRHELVDFKLGTVCKYYGIRVDEISLHGALYDTELVQAIYKKRFEK